MRLLFALFVPLTLAADMSSMLQVEVGETSSQELSLALDNIGEKIANLEIPNKANRLSINAMMSTLSGTKRLDDGAKDTLRQVITLLDDILVRLVNEKGAADVSLQGFVTIATACNSDGLSDDQDYFSHQEASETNHTACRTSQQLITSVYEDKCGTARTHLVNWVGPHCEWPDVEDKNQFLQYDFDLLSEDVGFIPAWRKRFVFVRDLYARFTTESDNTTYVQQVQDCIDHSAQRNLFIHKCDDAQFAFEQAFCHFKQNRLGMCNTRDACFSSAESSFDNEWTTMGPLSDERAVAACHIKHIKCLINNLIVHDSTDINACNNEPEGFPSGTACVAEYSNVKPNFPTKDACDRAQVAIYPGSPNWMTTTYPEAEGWGTTIASAKPNVMECH